LTVGTHNSGLWNGKFNTLKFQTIFSDKRQVQQLIQF